MYYVVSLHDALCSVLLYEVTCGHGRMMNVLFIACAVCGVRRSLRGMSVVFAPVFWGVRATMCRVHYQKLSYNYKRHCGAAYCSNI